MEALRRDAQTRRFQEAAALSALDELREQQAQQQVRILDSHGIYKTVKACIRQSRADFGLCSQIKVLNTLSLRAGEQGTHEKVENTFVLKMAPAEAKIWH